MTDASKTKYACATCGHDSPGHSGRCYFRRNETMKRKPKKVRRVVLGAGWVSQLELYSKREVGFGYFNIVNWHPKLDALSDKKVRLVAEVIK